MLLYSNIILLIPYVTVLNLFRCRTSVKKLFLCYITIEPPVLEGQVDVLSSASSTAEEEPIKFVFPSSFKDQEVLRTALQFALPCKTQRY